MPTKWITATGLRRRALDGSGEDVLYEAPTTAVFECLVISPDARWLATNEIGLDDLPGDWRRQEALTQRMGRQWLESQAHALLRVPSAVVPLATT